jgi:DNA-binding CsgD family transcriptional regulator
MDSDITDRIYECSFVPEQWKSVLGELAQIATARTGFLFVYNSRVHGLVSSTDLGREAMLPLVESGYFLRSERFRRFTEARHAGFLVEYDVYSDEELAQDPSYQNLMYPRGLGWSACTAVPLPTGDWFSISLERERLRGPVEASAIQQLNDLRPHLARSALLATRLRLQQAQAASETLAAIGLPALVLDDHGRVLAANHLIEKLLGCIRWRAQDRVSLTDRCADRMLRLAIANNSSESSIRSFPLRDVDSEQLRIAHLVPIRLSARDIFSRSVAVLVITPVAAPGAPPVELVQSLFDLTPTEARVARDLAAGKTVLDIATDGGVSANTIRTHVRGVLEKTGCNRQVDVVALLTAISSMRPPSVA